MSLLPGWIASLWLAMAVCAFAAPAPLADASDELKAKASAALDEFRKAREAEFNANLANYRQEAEAHIEKANAAFAKAAQESQAAEIKRLEKAHATRKAPARAKASKAGAPSISRLGVELGGPGDPVLISGAGFDAGTEVWFRIAPGRDVKAVRADRWQDGTQMYVLVPEATGLPDFAGRLWLKSADGKKSNPVRFRFIARREVKAFDPPAPVEVLLGESGQFSQGDFASEDKLFHGAHAEYFKGTAGKDVWCKNVRLENGWVVDSAEVVGDDDHGIPRGVRIDCLKDSDTPYLIVHYWCDPIGGLFSHIEYRVRMYVRGPAGTANKGAGKKEGT